MITDIGSVVQGLITQTDERRSISVKESKLSQNRAIDTKKGSHSEPN